ncbi:hypothetical protein [Sphingomonas sp. PWP1-2]|uniref:hypothetical protein n=1 Tax=Sphingomonas sp. PWP1-2 TaxID=2804558 RepID=UPI003CF3CEDE
MMLAAASIALLSTPALAAPCRDAKGKFIKCGTAAPGKSNRCKAANGKFAKCDMKRAAVIVTGPPLRMPSAR